MASYTININNKSGSKTAFYLFAENPQVDSSDSPIDYKTPIFQKSQVVDIDSGQASFEIDTTVYAICTTSEQDLKVGASVQTSDKKQVTLGTYTSAASVVSATYDMATGSGDLNGPVAASEINNPPGGFTIETGSYDFPTSNNFCIGIGSRKGGKNVPLSVFPAKPNTTYNIFPVVKYYVTRAGEYTPGQLINVKAIGIKHLVEFTAGVTTIDLDFFKDNKFYPSTD